MPKNVRGSHRSTTKTQNKKRKNGPSNGNKSHSLFTNETPTIAKHADKSLTVTKVLQLPDQPDPVLEMAERLSIVAL